jgi:hypothetical protein
MLAMNPADRARLASMLVGGQNAVQPRPNAPDVR